MEDYKVRMMDEAYSLWDKIMALKDFINTQDTYKELTFKQKFALRIQVFFMQRYYFWLCQRISMHCSSEDIEEYNNPVATTATKAAATEVAETKPKIKRKAKKNTKNE